MDFSIYFRVEICSLKFLDAKYVFDPYDYHISTCCLILNSRGLRKDLLEYHILESMVKYSLSKHSFFYFVKKLM